MKIVVYLGTGGVGKTSVSAATALGWARQGRRAIVLTTDPARRLRDALKLGNPGDAAAPQRVTLDPPAPGELWGALLDVKATLEQAVRLYGKPKDVDRILAHPIFATIASALPGMQELMAIERIDQLIRAGFSDFVIDTAPSRHALEFLDKPKLFAGFAGSMWVKLAGRTYRLAAASPLGLFGRTGLEIYAGVESLLGADLVRQILDFYSLFVTIAEGYSARANATLALLKDPSVAEFRIVSTPGKAEADAGYFTAQLGERGFPVGLVCVNRLWPAVPPVPAGARDEADETSLAAGLLRWYRSVQESQQAAVSRLTQTRGVVTLPELPSDVEGLASLERIRESMEFWRGA